MQKINFQNLPSTATPINATNLNALQDNAESAINLKADTTTLNGYVNGSTPMGNVVVDSIRTKNMFNKNNAEIKKFVDKTTGNISDSDDWSASDFIEIEPSTTYVYSGVTNSLSTIAGTAFYNSSKTFISGINSQTYTFTTPANAKYVRISLNTETPNQVQLEKGSTATDYASYQDLDIIHSSGTFSPNVRGETTAGTATYSIQEGQYEKIGKCLFYNFRIGCTLQNSAGTITIGGFPFTFTSKEASIGNVLVANIPNASSVDALRIYGQRFILNTGGISALSNVNWSSTGYIYGTGFIMLD